MSIFNEILHIEFSVDHEMMNDVQQMQGSSEKD